MGAECSHRYGFALSRHGVFRTLLGECSDFLDIPADDHYTAEEITKVRESREAVDFDDDHYLADLYETDEIMGIIDFSPWWCASDACITGPEHFTEDELDEFEELSQRDVTVDRDLLSIVWGTLTELVFAYAYDFRTNLGSPTSESAWLIGKLSPALSCTDSFSSPKTALIAAARRSLCYPLYRNFDLSVVIKNDVQRIFSLGRWAILKALLSIRSLMADSEDYRYILNDLYITEYCMWIQSVDSEGEQEFLECKKGMEFVMVKEDLGLDLEVVEEAGRLALLEEDGQGGRKGVEVVDLEEVMAGLRVDSDEEDEENVEN